MIFRKKRKMIDVRELQKRGVVRIPKEDVVIPTNEDGFVEFGGGSKPMVSAPSSGSSSGNLFGFLDSSSGSSSGSFGTETDGYNKREVDAKITALDNKIYKLEQRIELLERKAGVGDSSVGAAGW